MYILTGPNKLLGYNKNFHVYNVVAVITKRIMTYNKVQHNQV